MSGRPEVIVDVVFEDGLLFLSVSNIGDRPALDVQTTFNRKLVTGSVQRRNVGVILLDDDRNEVLRWSLRDAWIAKIEVADLDAEGNEAAIEAIELAHEGLELE